MAELIDRTVPYEILIRFGEDGFVQGAHFISRRIIDLDGERLKEEIGAARPLALVEDGAGRDLLDRVLGEALTTALADNGRLQAEIGAKDALIHTAEQAIAAAQASRDKLARQVALAAEREAAAAIASADSTE
jgi:hypothetical protein